MVFNATFNNITVISWQFVHKGDIVTVNACFWYLENIGKYGRKISWIVKWLGKYGR